MILHKQRTPITETTDERVRSSFSASQVGTTRVSGLNFEVPADIRDLDASHEERFDERSAEQKSFSCLEKVEEEGYGEDESPGESTAEESCTAASADAIYVMSASRISPTELGGERFEW